MSRHAVAIMVAVIGLLAGPGSSVAQAAGATLTLTPGSENYGTTTFRSPEFFTFTLEAKGANVGITSITAFAAPFQVTATTCGSVLPNGQSCTITVRFDPPDIKASYSGALAVFNTLTPSSPAEAKLTGASVTAPMR